MDDPYGSRKKPQPPIARPGSRGRHASFARKNSANEELWVIIGLVHDVDYEEHPDEHLRHAPEILIGEDCTATSV